MRTTPRCTRRTRPASRRSRRRRSSPSRPRGTPEVSPRTRSPPRRVGRRRTTRRTAPDAPFSTAIGQRAAPARSDAAPTPPQESSRRPRRLLGPGSLSSGGSPRRARRAPPRRRIRQAVSGRAPARAYPRWPRTPRIRREAVRGVSARRVPCRTPRRRRPRCERRPSPSRRRSSTPGFARVDPWRLERREQPGARPAEKGRAREAVLKRRVLPLPLSRPLLLLLCPRRPVRALLSRRRLHRRRTS
mmetsp:Transcript_4603/g.18975  ORF Transcript_4603/g.18975 Transcript_4603/m.18975 type:complete len:245 (-) Transcript_4603:3188-3922(-)